MKVPPLLIGLTILFWGVETERLLVGVILALVVESHLFIKIRYTVKEEQFVRISDLTSVLFIGTVALVLLNYEAIGFLRITTGWLPLVLAPLLLAQLYSTADQVIIGTQLGKKKKLHIHKPLDFRLYYFFICLFAAATANSRSLWFYPALLFLTGGLLFVNRGRAVRGVVFFLVMIPVALGGYLGMVLIEQGQQAIMRKSFRFMHRYYRGRLADPYKSHVNFGETGEMKLSGEIILRIASEKEPPALLREASYHIYKDGSWFGNQSNFVFLQPAEPGVWRLHESAAAARDHLKVEQSLPREKGLLPVPYGGQRLTSATIYELEKSAAGVVKVVDGAPVISYDLFYAPGGMNIGDPPQQRHLNVSGDDEQVIFAIAKKITRQSIGDAGHIEALKDFFRHGFSYSLQLIGRGGHETPLANFLLSEKKGFCEYYATATALLLRAMGIPSRYSVGFVVRERGFFNQTWVVRKRHAHAWAEAWVDGSWQVVDTTPPSWFSVDREKGTAMQPLLDLFAFLHHKYKLFQIGGGRDYTLYFSGLVVVLTVLLALSIYRRMRLRQVAVSGTERQMRRFDPVQTPLTQLLRWLEQQEEKQMAHESFGCWASRLLGQEEDEKEELDALYRLHLQVRFDPQGGAAEDLLRLKEGAGKYLPAIGEGKKKTIEA